MSNRTFISQFFKQKRMVGALAPSSKFLAAKMLNHLPIEKASIIVELGPGTGVFTNKIIKRMAPNAHLIVIELNDIFFENIYLTSYSFKLCKINNTCTTTISSSISTNSLYDNLEVDFVVRNNNGFTQYIQVSQTVQNTNTLERELAPFENIADHYEKLLITMDYDTGTYNGIKKINAIDWLINIEK